MTKLSANLGFLWTEAGLLGGIRRAAAAGFQAVECHWPYDVRADQVTAALLETGLAMIGLNTSRGDPQAGEFGLAALPGREAEARAAIDQALAYATATGTRYVHVMAGCPADPAAARGTYLANLQYAAERGGETGVGVLIEPINPRDIPGYYLNGVGHAASIIRELGASNLKLMFDLYHVQIIEGDLIRRLEANLGLIGHVQLAAVPSRREPDEGEVAFDRVLAALDAMGYAGFVGAEYRPRTTTDAGLGWIESLGLAR